MSSISSVLGPSTVTHLFVTRSAPPKHGNTVSTVPLVIKLNQPTYLLPHPSNSTHLLSLSSIVSSSRTLTASSRAQDSVLLSVATGPFLSFFHYSIFMVSGFTSFVCTMAFFAPQFYRPSRLLLFARPVMQ